MPTSSHQGYVTGYKGVKIFHSVTMADRPELIIFLHGLGGDLTAWQKERAHFSKLGFSSIAFDQRGHGLSDRPTNFEDYRVEIFVKDLLSLVNHYHISKFYLVGHCFGGMVSMTAAAMHPSLAQRLILIDTSYKIPAFSEHRIERTLLSHLFSFLGKNLSTKHISKHANFDKFFGTADLDFNRVLSDILHTSLKSYFMIMHELTAFNATELLSLIKIPSLVVEGSKDSVFPPEVALSLKNRIKNSEIDIVEQANHIIVLNNPVDLNKSIERFLFE